MSHTLEIRAFFFNAKTDYLPYYKNFKITMQESETAKDLLSKIHEANENFSYPEKKLLMNINHLLVEADESISNIVEKLGTTLQIDPVNSYRSNDGLKINDDDFMQNYELLAPFATEADLEYYKTLYSLHYASETENFERTYIGDAILLLAHKMITEGSEHKKDILHAITSAQSGLFDCEYENNLFNAQDHTEMIEALKNMTTEVSKDAPTLIEMIVARFSNKTKIKTTTPARKNKQKPDNNIDNNIDNLAGKYIAYYAGNTTGSISTLINEIGATEVNFSRAQKLSGLTILPDNKELALRKAGTTLLDAYDSGAEVLVVENETVCDMFIEHFSAIEKIIGRKMIGLDLISEKEFIIQTNSISA